MKIYSAMALHDIKSNQELNQELKDIFLNAGKMKTSPDFTQNIMNLIEKESLTNKIVYKPLISTRGWIGIALFILLIFIIAMMSVSDSSGQTSEIIQRINNIFSLKMPLDKLVTAFSRIGTHLLSSMVFISLLGLMGLGVIYSFIYLKIELLRKNQIYHS